MTDPGDILRNPGPVDAVDVFTDRVGELDAFELAVTRHRHAVSAGLTGFERAANRNVICFYGMGGIGKTRLSERLQRWVEGDPSASADWPPPPRLGSSVLTTRLDFDHAPFPDLEAIVKELRLSIGAYVPAAPSFDVALAAWWSRAHPDEPLPNLVAYRPTGPISLRDQLTESLKSAAEDYGVGFGVPGFGLALAKAARHSVRERRRRSVAEENPNLSRVLEAIEGSGATVETLAHLPLLLNWEVRRLDPAVRPLWIVFVDTFEVANGDEERRWEKLIQRIVYGLPDVLFVITGRNRLDWHDERLHGRLDRVGPAFWPGLAESAEDSDRHRVGDLSDTDARRYLERCWPSGQADPELIERMVAAAQGLPIFIDLAVRHLRDRPNDAVTGRVDVPVSFDGLVVRVMRDLPAEQRVAFRTACLFRRFDERLLVDVGGGTATSVARFVASSIVEVSPWLSLPCKIHDRVRESARRADPVSGNGWSEGDWREAIERAIGGLERRHAAETDPGFRLELVSIGIELALEHGGEFPWLRIAAAAQPTMRAAAMACPQVRPEQESTWAAWLVRFLASWLPSDGRPRYERLLEFCCEPTPPDIARAALRFRAYGLRSAGRAEEALAIFDELLSHPGSERLHRYQRGLCLLRLGRFQDVDDEAARLDSLDPDGDDAARLRGTLAQWHGDLVRAADAADARAAHLEARGQYRIAAENRAQALRCRTLTDHSLDGLAIDMVELGARLGQIDIHRSAAMALLLTAAGDEGRFARYLVVQGEAYPDVGRSSDLRDSRHYKVVLPRVFHAAVLGDVDAFRFHAARFGATTQWGTVARHWSRLLGVELAGPDDPVWLEPVEIVQQRWIAWVTRRRAALGLPN